MALIDLLDAEEAARRMDEVDTLLDVAGRTYESPYDRAVLHNPGVVEALFDFHVQLRESGPVDRVLYEYIMVVTATVNDCTYCAASHRKKLKDAADLSLSEVSAISKGDYTAVPERERTILEFVERVAEDPHDLGAEDIESLEAIGFDVADVLQLVTFVGECTISNTIMSALDIHPTD